jgi:hypothetical protein
VERAEKPAAQGVATLAVSAGPCGGAVDRLRSAAENPAGSTVSTGDPQGCEGRVRKRDLPGVAERRRGRVRGAGRPCGEQTRSNPTRWRSLGGRYRHLPGPSKRSQRRPVRPLHRTICSGAPLAPPRGERGWGVRGVCEQSPLQGGGRVGRPSEVFFAPTLGKGLLTKSAAPCGRASARTRGRPRAGVRSCPPNTSPWSGACR